MSVDVRQFTRAEWQALFTAISLTEDQWRAEGELSKANALVRAARKCHALGMKL